jgi:M6 family metalloprotease-like protein
MNSLRSVVSRAVPLSAMLSFLLMTHGVLAAPEAGAVRGHAAPPWPGVRPPKAAGLHNEGAPRPAAKGGAIGAQAAGTAVAAPAVAPALGNARWLALMVDFPDRPGISGAASFAPLVQGTDSSSLGGYYSEVSYGQFNPLGSLNGMAGWPLSQSACCGAGALSGPIAGPPGIAPLPNLRCYQPAGWSGAIVVSTEPSTNADEVPVFSDQSVFIDWAVVNDSAVPANSFTVALRIDGVDVRYWAVSGGLAPGAYVCVQDHQLCTLRPGPHVVSVCADVTNRVLESDEGDNCGANAFAVDATGPGPEWYRLPQTEAYYANNDYGLGAWPQNQQKLVADAVVAADPYVDYSQFDNDGDGEVDYLVVIYAGTPAEVTGNPGDLWSWQGELSHDGGQPITLDGVLIDRYALIPERQWYPCDTPTLLGVLAHEFGHLLGLPDLYDTDESSYGVGRWCLMGFGSQGNWGANPVAPCAWAKAKLGWLTPIEVGTSITGAPIPASETSPTVYRLRNHTMADGEYFLVENRQHIGADLYLPGDGLVIYHVDENQADNNLEWYCPEGTGSGHALVAVEQADGLWDLERNANQGDWADPWPGITGARAFGSATVPNSLSYFAPDPCQPTAGSISVANISDSAPVMTADLSANVAPTCAISAPAASCAGVAVGFVSDSTDPDGAIVSWAWDFGDGGASIEANPSHAFAAGGYTVVLSVTDDDGATSTCAQGIAVADDPLTVICPADISVAADRGRCQATLDPGQAVGTDDCGTPVVTGQRSDGLALTDPYPVGTTIITWTAIDAGGQTAVCQQKITVADVEAPVITACPANAKAVAGATCTAKLPKLVNQVQATDNCTATLTIIQTPDERTVLPVGIYPVTFTVTDQAGNSATCMCTVTITGSKGCK